MAKPISVEILDISLTADMATPPDSSPRTRRSTCSFLETSAAEPTGKPRMKYPAARYGVLAKRNNSDGFAYPAGTGRAAIRRRMLPHTPV